MYIKVKRVLIRIKSKATCHIISPGQTISVVSVKSLNCSLRLLPSPAGYTVTFISYYVSTFLYLCALLDLYSNESY